MGDQSDLLDGLRRGDGDARRALFERYFEPVVRRAARIVDDPGDAHDVAAGVFVDFLDRLVHTFRGTTSGSVYAYVETAAISRAVRFQKRRRLVMLALDGDPHEPRAPASSDEPQPFLMALLERCLAGLSARQREFVAMKYGQDLDNVEIAALLGVSRAAVPRGWSASRTAPCTACSDAWSRARRRRRHERAVGRRARGDAAARPVSRSGARGGLRMARAAARAVRDR